MATIRITKGVFPWNNGFVRAGDPPIEVDEALARRLVEQKGVAEYVTLNLVEETSEPDAQPVYHSGMTAKELREIGEAYGLSFKQGMSKADMVSKLDELFAEQEPEEDAPTFDAAEAVQ